MYKVDITFWNVSNGKQFEGMFCDAKNLTCKFNSWSLDSVECAENMFKNCDKLKVAPLLPQM